MNTFSGNKVSIVVPIYKVENYVERCVRSLFEQTYENIQYIFVNDCTPDKSIEIIREVLKNYPNRENDVIIINHKTNRGSSAARNTGIGHCSGEYVIQIDSDDYVEFNIVEELVREQQKGDYDIVSANLEILYPNKKSRLYKVSQDNRNKMICEYVRSTPTHTLVARLVKRNLYIDHDIKCVEDYNIAEDQQVMPQLCYYAKSFGYIDKCLYHYDCSNMNSQMHCELNINTIKQDVKAFEVLFVFFKNKDTLFYEAVISGHKEYIQSKLLYAIRQKDNSFYNEIILFLESHDKVFKECYNTYFKKLRYKYLIMLMWHYSILIKWKIVSYINRLNAHSILK